MPEKLLLTSFGTDSKLFGIKSPDGLKIFSDGYQINSAQYEIKPQESVKNLTMQEVQIQMEAML